MQGMRLDLQELHHGMILQWRSRGCSRSRWPSPPFLHLCQVTSDPLVASHPRRPTGGYNDHQFLPNDLCRGTLFVCTRLALCLVLLQNEITYLEFTDMIRALSSASTSIFHSLLSLLLLFPASRVLPVPVCHFVSTIFTIASAKNSSDRRDVDYN